ncbi:MerR family transcriptional regulator [Yoonia sp. R2331]|uniref:MerR family transcriptional regulator n=1 Tax=Yoonia sp. R2331 TaxID=3237238 RepID=UPI0034E4E9A3
MLINNAATASGLSADTIRFYAKSGMLPPIARDARGWRDFSPSDVDWLKTLKHLRATGMPLPEIKRFAQSAHAADADTPANRQMRLQIMQRHAHTLARRQTELDACAQYLAHKIALYSGTKED